MGQVDGTTVTTGFVCTRWGGVSVPGRFWVSIGVRPGGGLEKLGIDAELVDFLRRAVDVPASELWTCIREDHAGHVTFLDRCGFVECFRSWGAHLKLASFDASRWAGLFERLSADGLRLLRYPELHGDPDRDRKLLALQDAVENDVVHFEPIVPKRESEIIGPETILEALVVAVAPDDSYVGLACLLGSATDTSIGCGLTGVLPAYRSRGIATALKVRTAEIAKGWGAEELNTGGGGGVDAPIVRASRAIGFDIEPPWVTYSKVMEIPRVGSGGEGGSGRL